MISLVHKTLFTNTAGFGGDGSSISGTIPLSSTASAGNWLVVLALYNNVVINAGLVAYDSMTTDQGESLVGYALTFGTEAQCGDYGVTGICTCLSAVYYLPLTKTCSSISFVSGQGSLGHSNIEGFPVFVVYEVSGNHLSLGTTTPAGGGNVPPGPPDPNFGYHTWTADAMSGLPSGGSCFYVAGEGTNYFGSSGITATTPFNVDIIEYGALGYYTFGSYAISTGSQTPTFTFALNDDFWSSFAGGVSMYLYEAPAAVPNTGIRPTIFSVT